MNCSHCGAPQPPDAAFCNACGRPAGPAGQPAQSGPQPPAGMPPAPYGAPPAYGAYPAAYPLYPAPPQKPPKPRLPLRGADRGLAIATIIVASVCMISAYIGYLFSIAGAGAGISYRYSSEVGGFVGMILVGLLAFLCFLASGSLGVAGSIVCLCRRRAVGLLTATAAVQTAALFLRTIVIGVRMGSMSQYGLASETISSMVFVFEAVDWIFQLGFCILAWAFMGSQKKRFAPYMNLPTY